MSNDITVHGGPEHEKETFPMEYRLNLFDEQETYKLTNSYRGMFAGLYNHLAVVSLSSLWGR